MSPAANALVCAPCPARSSSGLGDLDAPQPPLGHRQRTPGEQTAPHAEGAVGLAGEPVAVPALGEQQQRPDHRGGEHGDGDQPDGRGQTRSGQALDGVAREASGVGACTWLRRLNSAPATTPIPASERRTRGGRSAATPSPGGRARSAGGAAAGAAALVTGSGRAARGAAGRPRPCSRRRARGPRVRRCRRWPTRSSPRTARRSGAPAGP